MNNNMLQPMFDLVWDSGIIFLKWLFDGWIVEKRDLNKFFKSAGLKNRNEEYPEVKKQIGDKYLVNIPTSLSLDDFNRYKDALEIYLQKKINMSLSGNFIMIEPRYELKELIKYKIPRRTSNSVKLPIGESIDKTMVLDLKENPHSYIVGTTGSGKSVMTKVILTSIVSLYKAEELELYLCDLKMVELNLFRNMEHTKKFVYTVEDTTQVIADLLEETKKRYDLFMQNEVTNIFEYNKLPGVKRLRYQVLYVEEIVLLLEDKNKTAMKLLKQLIAISRASGCYVFLTTQRPDNTVIDNVVKANINNRIVLKCEDSKNSVVALDQEGAEDLKGNGHGFLKNGSNIEEFRGYFIEDEKVKEYTDKFKKVKNIEKEDNCIESEAEEEIKVKSIGIRKKATTTNNETKEDLSNNIEDLSFLENL